MADFRAGARKVQDEPRILFVWEIKEDLEEEWRYVKRTEKPVWGTPTSQIWDNLSIKVNNNSYRL